MKYLLLLLISLIPFTTITIAQYTEDSSNPNPSKVTISNHNTTSSTISYDTTTFNYYKNGLGTVSDNLTVTIENTSTTTYEVGSAPDLNINIDNSDDQITVTTANLNLDITIDITQYDNTDISTLYSYTSTLSSILTNTLAMEINDTAITSLSNYDCSVNTRNYWFSGTIYKNNSPITSTITPSGYAELRTVPVGTSESNNSEFKICL